MTYIFKYNQATYGVLSWSLLCSTLFQVRFT